MQVANSPFPTLKTDRLILRATDFSDIEEIYFLRSDAEVNKYLGGGRCADLDAARTHIELVKDQFAAGKTFNWSICLKDSGQMVGSICLWNICRDKLTAELGYALHPQHQKLGYMDESMKAVLEFGFESEAYQLIEAYTDRNNLGSLKLLVKNGFTRDDLRSDEEEPGNHIYVLLREQWAQKESEAGD